VNVLTRVGLRYLLRHPWQAALMVIGITLGVAVAVAVDLANASAGRAFDLSTEAVTGRATHQITGGPQGLDQEIYARLLQEGAAEAAAPVISEYVASPQLGDRLVQLLGIDPFAEAPFRDYLRRQGEGQEGLPVGQLAGFLTQPGAVLISTGVAERYGLQACPEAGEPAVTNCTLELEVAGQLHPVRITGLLQPDGAGQAGGGLSARALEGLVLADIATAQELTGRLGTLDRVDLILPEECSPGGMGATQGSGTQCPQAGRIQALLPAEAQLLSVAARTGTVQEMTAAFRLNLTALSLLALVVGMFLIYNTMTFSVVQRRPLFGTLRCLGVTRREVFQLVLSEALAVGLIGATLGVGLGVLMGQGAVRLVTQTINDLYFVVTVEGVQVPPASLIKGALMGIIATILTAAPPAWEAASVPPRAALSRAGLEYKARRAVLLAAGAGALLLAGGGGLLLIPTRDLVLSFSGTFAVIVGFSLLAPAATLLLMRGITPFLGRVWGTLGRMAPRDVVNALSRTAVAVAALMVAVSVSIGVSLMVSSFRHTVVTWLDQTLQGDIYLSAPTLTATQSSAPLDPAVIPILQNWPGVEQVDLLRSATVDSPGGPVHVAATDNPALGEQRIFLAAEGTPEEIEAALKEGSVLVSEPFANRFDLPRRGARVTLITAGGRRDFPVAGIYYDYASSQGTVLMDLQVYRDNWNDENLTAAALNLAEGVDADALSEALQSELAPVQRLVVRPNRELRSDVLEVFDRTFAITGALQLLATVVAFIGVLSALLSLQLERMRELGILRAVGLTARQLWGLVMVETGLMGGVAGLLAMPTGFTLAVILIYIINRRSFGWTLQMQVDPEPFIQAFLVAVLAALLAGIYPAYRMGQMVTAEALHSE
jgi:putative ABC transport system permease protein